MKKEISRSKATREDILWQMDMKTAALKRIHRICNELLDEDQLDTPQFCTVEKIRENREHILAADAPNFKRSQRDYGEGAKQMNGLVQGSVVQDGLLGVVCLLPAGARVESAKVDGCPIPPSRDGWERPAGELLKSEAALKEDYQ